MDRKKFLRYGLLGTAGFTLAPRAGFAQASDPQQIDQEVIKEFVTAGHGQIDVVEKMLEEYPSLISSRYDWGNGDFEEAIEGAAHVGNKRIAEFLIEKGARVNLFILAMLNKKELVLPILEEYPSLITAAGAHGFTMLHHAKVGGATEIYDYLQSKGLEKLRYKD